MTEKNNLVEFMHCEKLDANLFRGQSKDLGIGHVFGGQVLGQAIKAAQNTVGVDRQVHSAHAYFLLLGDVNAPIIYDVDRSRDGGSFSSRRVVATQHGRPIFNLSASFQVAESGLEYYQPTELPLTALHNAIADNKLYTGNAHFDFLDVYVLQESEVTKPGHLQMWIKAKQTLPESVNNHSSMLAYMSDFGLLYSTLLPHGFKPFVTVGDYSKAKNYLMASLDHAIWFHRPFRVDDWLFYDCRVRSTGNGRGLSYGDIYSKDGVLVASTTQEGVIRLRR